MKKYILTVGIICLAMTAGLSQRNFVSFQYSMGFGTGDLGTYISPTSFRGATFDWRKYVQPNVGVGLEIGWNVFYEAKPYDTYVSGNASLSGKQYRYQNQMPILFAGDYFFKPGEKFNPFVGLGLGTMYSRRNTDMNLYSLQQDSWHFAVRPEVGFLYELNPSASAFVALKFYNGFQAGDLKQAQSYLTLNVGIAFTQ